MPAVMAGPIVSGLAQFTPCLHRNMDVELMPSIFVEVDKEEDILIEAVAEAYGKTFRTRVHSLQDLAHEFEALLHEWKKKKRKFIAVTNVGNAPTPDQPVAEQEANWLHRSDTEWIWPFLSGCPCGSWAHKDERRRRDLPRPSVTGIS